MFYEKLAEAKEEKKRLSPGQLAGIAGASALGGVAGHASARKLYTPMHYKKVQENIRKYHKRVDHIPMDNNPDFFRQVGGEFSKYLKKKRGLDRIRKRVGQGGGMLGVAALGYGAKKLIDRYNARKQQRN